MDTEAELIRSERWSELKNFYSKKAGYAWEQAWVSYLKTADYEDTIRQLKQAFQDPRYEEASYILLWKLGAKPRFRSFVGPQSLRLYEAYSLGELGPLLRYCTSKKSRLIYLEAFLERVLHADTRIHQKDVDGLEGMGPVSARAHYFLAYLLDHRSSCRSLADTYYELFLGDPWTARVLKEAREEILDEKIGTSLRHAYKTRDGEQVKRLLKACLSRIHKTPSLSDSWSKILKAGLQWDLDHLGEAIRGYPFWNKFEISPSALFKMRDLMFSKQERLIPPFFETWANFLETKKPTSLSENLEPDSKALWQLRVEMNISYLHEALLRFPSEERFLFLWTLQNQSNKQEAPEAAWPKDKKESKVVWKNLVRAFENSSNPVLWFDRLRQCGCSQDFYEYALSKITLPLSAVLEDLEENRLQISVKIRSYLREALSLVAPNDYESHALSEFQVLNALSNLTPAEKQSVLISRYVVRDLSRDILSAEVIDLLWDARQQVSEQTRYRWESQILEMLSEKSFQQFNDLDWKWVEAGWSREARYLQIFSPSFEENFNFPWESYLEAAELHDRGLFLMCLHRVPSERLKETWILKLLEENEEDPKLLTAITSLRDTLTKSRLLGDYYEKKGELQKSIRYRFQEFEETPILNEQIEISLKLLKVFQEVEVREEDRDKVVESLQALGSLDPTICHSIANLYEKSMNWEKTWLWTLKEWEISVEKRSERSIDRLLEVAFMAQKVEDCQRLLVDFVFRYGTTDAFTYRILDILLEEKSIFHIRHLRQELVDQASQIFPLHRNLLRRRAEDDYRAVILWKCFYKKALVQAAEQSTTNQKRRHELLGMTSIASSGREFIKFSEFFERYAPKATQSLSSDYLSKARRLSARLAKQYKQAKPDILLESGLAPPFMIYFEPFSIHLDPRFFEEMDDEIWSAFVVGALQTKRDWDAGLFEKSRLAERFFQGMLLAGINLGRLIRLWVWMALTVKMTEPKLIHTDPDELMHHLPFMNQLLIFYLSRDYEERVKTLAIPLL